MRLLKFVLVLLLAIAAVTVGVVAVAALAIGLVAYMLGRLLVRRFAPAGNRPRVTAPSTVRRAPPPAGDVIEVSATEVPHDESPSESRELRQ